MTEKRKRVVLSMENKVKALYRLDKGEHIKSVALDLGVGESTVKDWRRNRKEIEKFCHQVESDVSLNTRSTLKKPKHEHLDNALWLWFNQEKRKGAAISGPILKEKALVLNQKIGIENRFSASEGWLSRWKKRHGVYHLNVAGNEKTAMTNDSVTASSFIQRIQMIIEREGLLPEQLYNLDETRLNIKMLPRNSVIENQASVRKTNERITITISSNASGTHRLPLFVIGKSEKEQVFKNFDQAILPVYYRSAQRSLWLDSTIFKEWFFYEFTPAITHHLQQRNLPVKALLILSNTLSHPSDIEIECGAIKAIVVPSNITMLIHPPGQNVMDIVKSGYRQKVLAYLIAKIQHEGLTLLDALRTMDVKDAILIAARSWNEVPQSSLMKFWFKLWPDIQRFSLGIPHIDYGDLGLGNVEMRNETFISALLQLQGCGELQKSDVEEWLRSDDFHGVDQMDDMEIIQAVTMKYHETVDCENDDEPKISHSDGGEALELALRYVKQQTSATLIDVNLMRKWRDYAMGKGNING